MEPRKGLTISEPGFLMHLECSLLLVGLVTSVLYQLLDGTLVIAFKMPTAFTVQKRFGIINTW